MWNYSVLEIFKNILIPVGFYKKVIKTFRDTPTVLLSIKYIYKCLFNSVYKISKTYLDFGIFPNTF